MQYYSRLACEQGEGKEGGKEKREAVEMPKDFDFHMPLKCRQRMCEDAYRASFNGGERSI